MHELSLIQSIFTVIEETAVKNHLRKVTKVCLKIGKLRQVMPDFLQFAFTTISEGTLAEGAELVLEFIPITILCHSCKEKITVKKNTLVCPNCQSAKIEILTGKEVLLDCIEGDD